MKSFVKWLNKFTDKYYKTLLLYFILSALIFLPILIARGPISGGDWGLPVTTNQLNIALKSSFSAWENVGDLFGVRTLSPMSFLFYVPLKILNLLGISVVMGIKLILVFTFALAASNLNLLLRYIKLNKTIALASGLIFITMPAFFNYSLMGWNLVLLSMALIPLFVYLYLVSIDKNSYTHAFLAAIVMSLAILQSQTIFWYPMILIAIVVSTLGDKGKLLSAIKMGVVVMVSFIALNLYWLLGLILFPDASISNNEIVTSSISQGTSARLSSANIIRNWGSLFNYQFESTFRDWLVPVSFIGPLLLAIAYGYSKMKKELIYLGILFLVPFLFYVVDRSLIAMIPFGSVIRDVARFSILSAFALTSIIAISINSIINSKLERITKTVVVLIIAVVLVLNALPFFDGSLFLRYNKGTDFRMRTYDWPSEHLELEQKFLQETGERRALFLPIGGMLSIDSDTRFSGAYMETWDVYANFSSIPGMIGLSDKDRGSSGDILDLIDEAIVEHNAKDVSDLAEVMGIDYIVYRRDVKRASDEVDRNQKIEKGLVNLVTDEKIETYFDKGDLLVLKFQDSERLRVKKSIAEIALNLEEVVGEMFPGAYPDIISQSSISDVSLILDARKIISDKSAYSFERQNNLFGQVEGEFDRSVFGFISLSEISTLMKVKKLNAERDNLNEKLDSIMRDTNQEVIKKVAGYKSIEGLSNKFALYNSDETGEFEIYLKSQEKQCVATLNDNEISTAPQHEGVFKVTGELTRGINIVESENCLPIFAEKSETNIESDENLEVVYEKINPTKYELVVKNPSNRFNLELNDNFDSNWKLEFNGEIIGEKNRYISNGYSNGWMIDRDTIQSDPTDEENLEFTLEYLPQRYYIYSSYFSLIFLIIILGYITLKISYKNDK